MAKSKGGSSLVTNGAGELKARTLMELIERPATAHDALATLQRYGAFEGNRFVVRSDVTPGEYARFVLPAAATLGDRAEWAVSDVLAWGERFDSVEAFDVETGEEADSDLAFEEGTSVVPYQHDQVVADIVPYTGQTLMNRRSVARRFTPDKTSNPAWAAAKYSHYAVCAPRDLPDDLVDGWLRLAGKPKAEGGLSVEDLERLRAEWRAKRDAQDRDAAHQLTAAPKPGAGDGDGPGAGGGSEVLVTPDLALQACRAPLQRRIAAVVDLPDATMQMLVRAIVSWMYDGAPEQVLRSAIGYDGHVDSWDD